MFEIAGGIILAVLGLVIGGVVLVAAWSNIRAIGTLLCMLFVVLIIAQALAG